MINAHLSSVSLISPATDRPQGPQGRHHAGTEAGLSFTGSEGERERGSEMLPTSPLPHSLTSPLPPPPSAQLTDPQRVVALKRWERLQRYDDLQIVLRQRGEVLSAAEVSAVLSEPNTSIHKLLKLCPPCPEHGRRACCDAQFQRIIPKRSTGRPPRWQPSAEQISYVKSIFVRLDESTARGRGNGASRVTAWRLAAKSEDAPCIDDAFRENVLGRRGKDLAPILCRLLDAPSSVIDRVRDDRSTFTTYISTPRGRHYIDDCGDVQTLRCGDSLQADDGTLPFYATIPWPFGGDECSEKFGVRLGRWQMLAVVDVKALFCPIFHIVARPSSAYRGEDVAALLGSTMLQIVKPEWWCLERGSWESDIVQRALQVADVRVTTAWESKQKAAIEQFWDRLWTPLSLMPGHSGRDRGRFKQTTELALSCQAGRHDPRKWFLPLTECVPMVSRAVQFANSEPIESRVGWGTWVPEERWNTQMAETSLRRLPGQLSMAFAREQRVWTVRGAGLGGMCQGPCVKFPVFFQCEQLWEFEGCKVKCFFDPYADPVLGTLVLEEKEWRNYRKGHIIATDVIGIADPMDLPPMADFSGEERDEALRTLNIRKAIAKAVRVETWNYLGTRTTKATVGNGLAPAQLPPPTPSLPHSPAPSGPAATPPQRLGRVPETTPQQRRSFRDQAAIAARLITND